MFEGESILWFLLLIPILYLGAPLFVLLTQRVAAHPKFEALNFDQLSPATAQFLMSRTKGLFELGFDEPTLFHLVDAVPNVTAYKILLVNRPAGDKALVSAVIARHRRVFLVEFSTRFEDGEVFDTHNISIPLTCPFPGHVRTQVPQVTDVRQLYKLHTYILNKHGAVRGTVLHEPGRALDYFAQVTFPEFTEEQVSRGWMYYREGTDCYHYTIKGAFLMTWGLMQPFKAIRKSLMWRRARAIMDEFKQHTSD